MSSSTVTITTPGRLAVGTIISNYSTYPTYDSSYIIGIPLTSVVSTATGPDRILWFKNSSSVHIGYSHDDATFARVVAGTYIVVFNARLYSVSSGNGHYNFIIRIDSSNEYEYTDNDMPAASPGTLVKHISITKIIQVPSTANLKIGYGSVTASPEFRFAQLEVCKIG